MQDDKKIIIIRESSRSQKLNVHVGMNDCTSVEIHGSLPMYTEDAGYVRETYVAFHAWT
jgi:hypothetical protein